MPPRHSANHAIYSKWFGLFGDGESDPVFCNDGAIVAVLPHLPPALPQGSFHSQSVHRPLIQLHHVSLNFSSIKHCYSGNKGNDWHWGWGAWEKLSWQGPKFRDEASSDEEDDAFRHHDLVVLLHLVQRCLDLL